MGEAARIPYAELLRDPRWQKRRLEVLQAAGWRCSRCRNQKANLQVHHSRYIRGRMPWDYPDELLAVLCDDCHELQHRPKPTADDTRREQQIARLNRQLIESTDPTERRQIVAAMTALVNSRTPEQAKRMEVLKGLR